jgi:hypothetical protein
MSRHRHNRDHYPRRPRPVNRPPERKPELAATTPKTRRSRPPVVRYVPVVRHLRRPKPIPVDPPTDPPTFEVEIEYSHRQVVWLEVAVLGAVTAWMGYYVYGQHSTTVFFPGDAKWVFWVMTGSTAWILIDKLMDERK